MSKILITGVAGLLGSRLSDWVINNTNYEVVGIDDLSGGFTENINPKKCFGWIQLFSCYHNIQCTY